MMTPKTWRVCGEALPRKPTNSALCDAVCANCDQLKRYKALNELIDPSVDPVARPALSGVYAPAPPGSCVVICSVPPLTGPIITFSGLLLKISATPSVVLLKSDCQTSA